jgi:hypothetical protein
MKKFLLRLLARGLSDQHLMTLYTSVHIRIYREYQRTFIAYWIEEGTVARIPEDELNAWAARQMDHSVGECLRLSDLRTLIMSLRPKLFAHHSKDPLNGQGYNKYWWEGRETYKAYRAIIEAREASEGTPSSTYQRTKPKESDK